MSLSHVQLQQRYEDCVELCADSLYRVAFRLTGNQTLANELVQETYLNAWKSLDSLSDPKKMRSWMFSILRNQYTKLIRKESRQASTSDQAYEAAARDEPDPSVSETIQSAISKLDPKHRMPVLLVSMEGMSVDEAAGILEIPRGTVLSRLHRGRQKLKELLMHSDLRPGVSERKQ